MNDDYRDFLYLLDQQKNREIFARITALSFDEKPIDQIEGRVTSGSVNIDGNSTVRRTCNLSMITENININDYYWGIKTKFKLEIGLQNTVGDIPTKEYTYRKDEYGNIIYYKLKDGIKYYSVYELINGRYIITKYVYNDIELESDDTITPVPVVLSEVITKVSNPYPDIIWFKQGIFVINTFNTVISTNNCQINVTGKDKMCLINGDLGGQLFASIDFGKDQIETYKYKKVNLDEIKSYTSYTYYIHYKVKKIPNEQLPANLKNAVEVLEESPIRAAARRQIFDEYIITTDTFLSSSLDTLFNRESLQISDVGRLDRKMQEKYNKIFLPGCWQIVFDETDKNLYTREIEIELTPLPLKKIIQESVHTYAQEPYQNIILNDLDQTGLELLSYRGSKPLFVLRSEDTGTFDQISMQSLPCLIKDINTNQIVLGYYYGESGKPLDWQDPGYEDFGLNWFLYDFESKLYDGLLVLDSMVDGIAQTESTASHIVLVPPTVIMDEEEQNDLGYWQEVYHEGYVKLAKQPDNLEEHKAAYKLDLRDPKILKQVPSYTVGVIEYGDDIGYQVVDLVYAGDLISSIGDTFTSVLDKIKTMLSDFEYFYDIDGHFVFQRQQTFVNTSWSLLGKHNGDEKYVLPQSMMNPVVYNFEGNNLITSFNNTPMLNNLRNDFSIWGKRESVSGVEIPIHVRYAIDKKPLWYCNYQGIVFATEEGERKWDEIKNEYLRTIASNSAGFTKEPVPDFLDENWWDITNWAEYYKILTGTYPTSLLKDYGTFGFTGTLTFPNGLSHTFHSQLVIDLERDTHNPFYAFPNGKSWSPFQHGFNGCYHTYTQFLNNNQIYNMQSFIYKPIIPNLDDIDEKFKNKRSLFYLQTEVDMIVDWREIIYQMALDYMDHQGQDDFLPTLQRNNEVFYPEGITGYEQYYTDILGFWRELYDPWAEIKVERTQGNFRNTNQILDAATGIYRTVLDWQNSEILDLKCDFFLSKTDKESIYNKLVDIDSLTDSQKNKYDNLFIESNDKRKWWNKQVFEHPEKLNFWIEFLDDGELTQFSVPQVGTRSKVINDEKVTSVYFKQIPEIIFQKGTEFNREQFESQTGYTFVFTKNGMENLFSISYRGKSAKERVDELLYENSYCIENVTINALPVYYLEPNTRIFIYDETTGINGEYIINKITLPLTYNGTMTINATKAPKRLY